MAQPQLILAFDVVNNLLVSNWQGSRSGVPQFSQSNYTLRLYLLQPNPDAIVGSVAATTQQYSTYDLTGFDGVRLGLWSNSTGTLDDSSGYLLALTPHTGFTLTEDEDGNECFEGEFNTFTQQIADWLGAAQTKAAYLACYLVSGVTLTKVYDQQNGQTNALVNSATDDGSGILPIDMTQEIPLIPFPCHFRASSGNVYALEETSPGVVQWVWLNPS